MTQKLISVLLVEDNEDHVELIIQILRNAELIKNIYVATDGQEALAYLFNKEGRQEKEKYTRPDFILLDIKLPKINGIEVLKKLKKDNELKEIPVVILTTSENPKDIKDAYVGGANSYISKPVNYKEFKEKIYGLQNYWVEFNSLITQVSRP